MTEHEMRIRLAEAMGYRRSAGDCQYAPWLNADGYLAPVPDPLDGDRDAAQLRAWCVGQGWRITCCHDEGAAWWRVSDLRCQGPRAEALVDANEEPDYCRRERLALCRAVLAVLEAGGAPRGPL